MLKILVCNQKIVTYGKGSYILPNSNCEIVNEESTIKVLISLCESNNIQLTKHKNKNDLIEQIENHLIEHFIETKDKTMQETINEVVKAGFEDELTDMQIQEKLYEAGVPFSDLKKSFNQSVIYQGLRLTTKDRNEKAFTFLEGYEPTDSDSLLAKISELAGFLGCASTSAGASMRAWAKVNDIELPKVAKETTPRLPGFGGKHKIISDWVLENPTCTKQELWDFAKENIAKTKQGKEAHAGYANDIWNALHFAKTLFPQES